MPLAPAITREAPRAPRRRASLSLKWVPINVPDAEKKVLSFANTPLWYGVLTVSDTLLLDSSTRIGSIQVGRPVRTSPFQG
jgi:hypothetical protein